MSDIVERLEAVGCDREPFTQAHAQCVCRLTNEAADAITSLRSEREALLKCAEALEMVRDADKDCHLDGLRTIPPGPRAKIDAALAALEQAQSDKSQP